MSALRQTDMANAELLVQDYGRLIRWDGRRWWLWNGQHWVPGGDSMVEKLAKQMVKSMGEVDPEWAFKSESAHRIKSMVHLAKSEVPITADQFDRQDLLLNCANGTMDLQNLTFNKGHRPEHYFTRMAPAEFDSTYTLPAWDEYIRAVTDNDPALMDYLQQIAGLSLLGGSYERGMYIIHGPKASGKSTFVEALAATLGPFGVTVRFKATFGRKKGDTDLTPAIARLAGFRLVVANEVPQNLQVETDVFKLYTTGDTMDARGLYQGFTQFRATGTLILVCNDLPQFEVTDAALWDRIKVVEFPRSIPKSEQNPELRTLLQNPDMGGKAILNWAAQGLKRYRAAKMLQEPACVVQWTAKHQQEQHPVVRWVEERIQLGDFWVSVEALHTAYAGWCVAEEEAVMPKKEFSRFIAGLEGVKRVPHKARGFHGLFLKAA